MIRIVVSGAAGRMGRLVVEAVAASEDFTLMGAIERSGHPDLGKPYPCGISLLADIRLCLQEAEVVIDFSTPAATLSHLEAIAKAGKGAVIGTTGFSAEERKRIAQFAQSIPCLLSPNMSLGMNVLFEIVKEVRKRLSDYDVAVLEAHHKAKRDAPSGTALKITEMLALAQSASSGSSIPTLSIRAGDITGDHTVLFAGAGERIEITHRAHSRECFVQGALRAARFVAKSPPGLYSMADVLR